MYAVMQIAWMSLAQYGISNHDLTLSTKVNYGQEWLEFEENSDLARVL